MGDAKYLEKKEAMPTNFSDPNLSFCNEVQKKSLRKNLKIQNLSHQALALEMFLRTLVFDFIEFSMTNLFNVSTTFAL